MLRTWQALVSQDAGCSNPYYRNDQWSYKKKESGVGISRCWSAIPHCFRCHWDSVSLLPNHVVEKVQESRLIPQKWFNKQPDDRSLSSPAPWARTNAFGQTIGFTTMPKIEDVHKWSSLETWLVLWNLNFIFPFTWEFHHPNWRTHIFQTGGSTTNQNYYYVWENNHPLTSYFRVPIPYLTETLFCFFKFLCW